MIPVVGAGSFGNLDVTITVNKTTIDGFKQVS